MIGLGFAWDDCALALPFGLKRQSMFTRILLHQEEETLKMTKLCFAWGDHVLELPSRSITLKLAYCITRVKTLMYWVCLG